MRAKLFLPLLAAALLAAGAPAMGEGTRPLYVGDIIAVAVHTREVSAETLRELFKGFEILEIKDIPGGRSLSMRTFETGERSARIGNAEIGINVRSTLDEIQRDDIFEADIAGREPAPFALHAGWLLFGIAAGLGALSGGYVLLRGILARRKKPPDPARRFFLSCGALNLQDKDCLVPLTFCFKEYLESLAGRPIIGWTSAEIMEGLRGFPALAALLPGIRGWLAECDRLKFTGAAVSGEEIRRHCEGLLGLVAQMDGPKEGAV